MVSNGKDIYRQRLRRQKREMWRHCLEPDEHGYWLQFLDEHYCENVGEPRYDRKGNFQAFDHRDCQYLFNRDSAFLRRHLAIQRHWLHQTKERQFELEMMFSRDGE